MITTNRTGASGGGGGQPSYRGKEFIRSPLMYTG